MPRILCRFAVISSLVVGAAGCAPSGGAASYTYAPPASGAPAAAPTGGASGPPSVAPSALASAAAPSSSAATASPPAPSASASTAGGPSITLDEWQVVAAGTMKPGKSNLTITNAGALPHELLIFKSDRDPKAYPVDASGDIKEEGAGVALVSDGENIDPGGTQTRSVDLAPGKYMFVCNIPTHFKQGMYEIVIVTK
jgi:uncharacterized cupredoxin-like copper-binding protein